MSVDWSAKCFHSRRTQQPQVNRPSRESPAPRHPSTFLTDNTRIEAPSREQFVENTLQLILQKQFHGDARRNLMPRPETVDDRRRKDKDSLREFLRYGGVWYVIYGILF